MQTMTAPIASHSVTWRMDGKKIRGVKLTVKKASLFVPQDQLRMIADRLHDEADRIEGEQ